jgi:3-hydroxyacyl-CoA dehydrogenase/enoyl-CoA hydratase/3-hydroxybutyryl-CoA epimerase
MESKREADADGVAKLCMPEGAFGPQALGTLERGIKACLTDASVCGLVLLPGGGRFGGELDLTWLREAVDADPLALEAFAHRAAALASLIEGADKPVAATITADAHGVGLEIALACHRRFGTQGAGYSVGFTDGQRGLPSLCGSAPRLAARLGRDAALRLLRDAAALTPAAAHKAGLIDELRQAEQVIDEARRWVVIEAARRAQRPADRAHAATLAGTQGVAAAFVEVARSGVARDMVRTLGLSVADANRLASRPVGVPTRRFARVGVLGAGLMGGGIALVAARAGMDVVLVDRTLEAAQRGLAALAKQEVSGVAAGRLDAKASQATLARITPTDRYGDLAGVDIVVEAVFEDRSVKAEATRLAEAAAGPRALFATNTSTLPITGLAEASGRPEAFIGLHFFSPVPRMPLLEIIRGRQTSNETLAHAMDFARAIGKTPIVVNDARGFYTTRVVMAYQAEAFDMLAQGCDPAVIEAGGVAAGMPVPPLALSDAVALDLIHQINLQAARDLGDAYTFTPGYVVVGRMVEELDRKGKKNDKGFYDYGENGSREIWSGLLAFAAGERRTPLSVADARDRLLAAQALETVRCLDEGVINDPSQCDVGAILGWGFAPWTGGPLSWIDRIGVASCVARCEELAQRYNAPRLQPTQSLRRLAAQGSSVYAARWPVG